MRKHWHVFIIAAVMLLILLFACTAGDVDVTPEATPDIVVQTPLPEDKPPAQESKLPP